MNIYLHATTTAIALLCLTHVSSAQHSLSIDFQAPGLTHITYSGSVAGITDQNGEIKLLRIDPSSDEVILDQASGPTASISGTLRDANLEPGQYEYRMISRQAQTGEWSEWETRISRTVMMTTTNVQGILQFDEVLDDVILSAQVTVPANHNLTLNGKTATLSASLPTASTTNLLAYGELTFGSHFSVSNVHFVIAAPEPVEIAGIDASMARFTLKEGGVVQHTTSGTFTFEKEGLVEATNGGSFIFQTNGRAERTSGSTLIFYGGGDVLDSVGGSASFHDTGAAHSSSNMGLSIASASNLDVSGCNNVSVAIGRDAIATITDSTLAGIGLVTNGAATRAVLNNVTVTGPAYLYGGTVEVGDNVAFDGNVYIQPHIIQFKPANTKFKKVDISEVSGEKVEFTDCLFAGEIEIRGGSPIFAGCEFGKLVEFYGQTEAIFIGNLFFDAIQIVDGIVPWSAPFEMLPTADALTSSPVSSQRHDRRVLPSFWINGMIYGQSTIDHQSGVSAVNIRNRESLLSVNLVCSDDHTRGARLYVEWDGKTIETFRRSGLPVHRNMDLYPATLVEERSVATFDFALPAVDRASETGLIWIDLSGVQGYEPEAYPSGPSLIGSFNIAFEPPPERPLRIAVVPIEITGLFSSWGTGNPADVIEQLDKLPDMLPLPSSHLEIDLKPVHRERSPSGAFQPVGVGTLNWLTSRFAAKRGMQSRSRFSRDTAPDFYVLVLPQQFVTGYFSGIWDRLDTSLDGAMFSSLWRNRIVLVAEHKPSAVLHELGHCVGLNTGSSRNEQYYLYPPAGLPLEAATLRGVESGLPAGRHTPRETDFWFRGFSYYDIMGNTDRVWMRTQTILQFHQWFQQNLKAPAYSYTMMADRSSDEVSVQSEPDPVRRILLSAIVAGSTLDYVSLRAVSARDMDPLPPPEGYTFEILAMNGQGTVVYSSMFHVIEDGIFFATFDLPADALSIRITDADDPEWIYFESQSANLVSNEFVRPTPNAFIDDAVELEWSYTTNGSTSNAVIHHSLYYRTYPAETWQVLALETDATNLTINAAFLPPNAAPELLLVTSDGITQVSNTLTIVTGTPSPQPPSIAILSPLEADVGDTNTLWILAANSLESNGDPTADPGEWTSSLDGLLGNGRMLDSVLTTGTHVIAYSATAANGLAATASVSVVVYEVATEIDLFLEEDSLSFINENIDPTGLTSAFLWPDVTNTFSLRVRNQGVDGTIRASLSITPQGGDTVALGTVDLEIGAFLNRVIEFNYVPGPHGAHIARAEIELLGIPDPVPENNVIEKIFYAPVGVALSVEPPEGGNATGQGLYGYGAQATVRAFPASNYDFAGWRENNQIVSTDTRYTFTTEMQRTLTAVFEPHSTDGIFAGGSGTSGDPFLIATAIHLNNVRLYPQAHFRQAADISLADFQEDYGWEPIVCIEYDDPFTGTYNGNGHKITDLFSNNPFVSFVGLFGSVRDAHLENITMENANVTGSWVAGILAGTANTSTIINCRVTGHLRGRTPGGLVGTLNNTLVRQCHTDVAIRGLAQTTILGGIAGGLLGRYTAGQIQASYYDSIATGQLEHNGHGFARTTAEMTYPYDAGTYAGWEFITIWMADTTGTANDGYPHLLQSLHTPRGTPHVWLARFGLTPEDDERMMDDHYTVWQHYIADTNPTNPASFFPPVTLIITGGTTILGIDPTSERRLYHIICKTNLNDTGWTSLTNALGTGGPWTVELPIPETGRVFYRGQVTLP